MSFTSQLTNWTFTLLEFPSYAKELYSLQIKLQELMETIKIYFRNLNILQYGSLSHYKDFFVVI